jgi:hypothetical protein
LAKSQEDKESLQERIKKMAEEQKVSQNNLSNQLAMNKQNNDQI